MSQTFECDVCHAPVTEKHGRLHSIESSDTVHGDMFGFAFYSWNEAAALDPNYGHVHVKCIPQMMAVYFQKCKWGRIQFGNRSVIVTEKKLARRQREKAS